MENVVVAAHDKQPQKWRVALILWRGSDILSMPFSDAVLNSGLCGWRCARVLLLEPGNEVASLLCQDVMRFSTFAASTMLGVVQMVPF